MAAFMGAGIDNAEIILSSCEVPIMDGSSKTFLALINASGLKEQISKRKAIKVLKEVSVSLKEKSITIKPSRVLSVKYKINFSDPVVGQQKHEVTFINGAFKEEISAARTFGFLNEVKALRKSGLALGGSLNNSIVVDNGKILNPEGLRYKDEFVRHKILDFCGDMYLAGKKIIGSIEANCAGHELNNIFLRRLLDNEENYDIVDSADYFDFKEVAIA
jgi:UDP-3-O-[3-hydroxymyristoyl] N-acetylglucosamine deacetylase